MLWGLVLKLFLIKVVVCFFVTVEVTQIVRLLRSFPDAALPLTYPSPSFILLQVVSTTWDQPFLPGS